MRSGSVTGTSYITVSSAVSASSDIRGGVTVATCSRRVSSSYTPPSTCSGTTPPSDWCSSTCAVAPPIAGKWSRSCSMPTWARASATS